MASSRMFTAINLPEAVRDGLAQLQDPSLRGVRWVRAENLHLTLSFLGNAVPDEAQARLKTALAGVQMKPFFLPIAGLGSFGGKRPAVLWAGVGRGHPNLFALHKGIVDTVLNCGVEPDLRRFSPHVTLARCGPDVSAGSVHEFLKRHGEFDAGQIRVDGFVLFSSRPSAGGSEYTPELEVTWQD